MFREYLARVRVDDVERDGPAGRGLVPAVIEVLNASAYVLKARDGRESRDPVPSVDFPERLQVKGHARRGVEAHRGDEVISPGHADPVNAELGDREVVAPVGEDV